MGSWQLNKLYRVWHHIQSDVHCALRFCIDALWHCQRFTLMCFAARSKHHKLHHIFVNFFFLGKNRIKELITHKAWQHDDSVFEVLQISIQSRLKITHVPHNVLRTCLLINIYREAAQAVNCCTTARKQSRRRKTNGRYIMACHNLENK